MKNLLLAFLLLFPALVQCQSRKTPKAVFIIVDGIPGDVIEKLQPPALMEISKAGGFTLAYTGGVKGSYNQTPTISAPGYIDLISGVWGNKHNVWDNDIAEPNYNYWNIFRIAKKANPSIKTAVFSTWTDNRTKLVGEGLEATGNFIPYPQDRRSRIGPGCIIHPGTRTGSFVGISRIHRRHGPSIRRWRKVL
jgi:hypothetical protein